MSYTIELNSIRRDADFCSGKIKSTSPVVEIFSAMAEGKDLSKYGKQADKAVAYIKSLGEKAVVGDPYAISELNTIRRFAIEPKLLEEIKLLGLFGSYENVNYGDTIEREVYSHEGEKSRFQALGGDVVTPAIVQKRYPVSSVSISGGYAVDYRRVQLGDMSKENEGMNQVRVDIRNKATLYVVTTIYNALKNASGVKHFKENAGITKSIVDGALKDIRRYGKPNIFGDYSVVSQIDDLVPFDNGTVKGISDAAMEEIRKESFIRTYKGSTVAEIPNSYDYSVKSDDGTNYKTILPEGILFVLPTGITSPVKTWSKGGITSLAGTDATTGKLITRYDLEIACDVAKGQEDRISLISDTNYEVPSI